MRIRLFPAPLLFALSCVLFGSRACGEEEEIVRLDPPELGFFSKQLTVRGIPIKAHADVSDAALYEARRRLDRMLRNVPDVVENLVEAGAEMQIIGKDQQTSDLPSLRHWKGKPFQSYGKQFASIDQRARGMGGLAASCGEENLLKLPSDRYKHHRDICTHEFAHAVFNFGLSRDVRELIERQHRKSTEQGLWRTAYASTNADEYFAELSMWYVGSRGDYGKIDPRPQQGREWLRRYDPEGFDVLDAIYSGRQEVGRITWKDLPARAAEEESTLRSTSSANSTTVLFDNRTATDYALYWLDFEGRRKSYGTIHAGQKQGQQTFATHPWVIVDPDGDVVAIYVGEEEPGKVVIE